MEPGPLQPRLDQFLLSPLVTWVGNPAEISIPLQNSLIPKPLPYQHLTPHPPHNTVPLTQVKTFVPGDGDGLLDISDLLDGVLLNHIMMQM